MEAAALVRLREEGDPIDVGLDDDVASALSASLLVAVDPRGGGRYRLAPGSRVGSIRISASGSAAAGNSAVSAGKGVEVRVEPKVGIARLLFLLGYAADPGWRDEDVPVDEADGLLPSVIDTFARAATRTLAQGVLQGYRSVDDALPLVRGRILAGRQMGRRFALPLPVEVRFDEYDHDIAENQILRAACALALTVPRLRDDTRARLAHALARLDGVHRLLPAAPLPAWRPSRLNNRYVPALRLAHLLLDHLSVEHQANGGQGAGELVTAGFVVSMWKAFEDFATVALKEALATAPGVTHPQYDVNLDTTGLVPMRPDLVHVHRGRPMLVIDAKYKAERSDGYPNADAYQMLAYCTALRLTRGHLVYARGNERPRTYDVAAAGTTIDAHALDLRGTPTELIIRVRELAGRILTTALTR